MAVSMSAACMVFKSMFSPALGIVNAILGTQLGWLESRSTALYTIIILTVWMLNCFADTAQSGGSFVICPFSFSWVFPCRKAPDTLQTARQSGAAWASCP